jgi:hypothetical protein
MRLITDDPEFTWSGTLFIVGAFAVAFTAQGVALAVRRRGWPRWAQRTVNLFACVLALPLGAGAGSFMLPALVTGSVAAGRTNWPWPVRIVLFGLAGLNAGAVFVLLVGELPLPQAITGGVMMLVVYGVIIRVIGLTLRPVRRRSALPAGRALLGEGGHALGGVGPGEQLVGQGAHAAEGG